MFGPPANRDPRVTRSSQNGLSLFGALVILAILAGAGYYLYTVIMATDAGPGCNDALNSCMRYCRRSTTDNEASQKCQANCQREAEECNRGASR
jgi:hypothetical protein